MGLHIYPFYIISVFSCSENMPNTGKMLKDKPVIVKKNIPKLRC